MGTSSSPIQRSNNNSSNAFSTSSLPMDEGQQQQHPITTPSTTTSTTNKSNKTRNSSSSISSSSGCWSSKMMVGLLYAILLISTLLVSISCITTNIRLVQEQAIATAAAEKASQSAMASAATIAKIKKDTTIAAEAAQTAAAQAAAAQAAAQQSSATQQQQLLQASTITTSSTVSNNKNKEKMAIIRRQLVPSVWTLAGTNSNINITERVLKNLTKEEYNQSMKLCGKFLYSTIRRAIYVSDLGEQTFVATGDIDDMWTRDSAVQIGIYYNRFQQQPWLRLIVEGAIRRQAFNIIQDPYANAYEHKWLNPTTLEIRDRVIGRGGWVATRNYELDSGAYFMTQLYDYYMADQIYRPEVLLNEPLIYDAVLTMINVWIVEQHHDQLSPYRYFELPNEGKGSKTNYTGMSWSGFRPSDDKSTYGYSIPSNIFAAAGLERILVINEHIWNSPVIEQKAKKLLNEIERGIQQYGIVNTAQGRIYAYEVDGFGSSVLNFDDANVPSLLSIPILGWSKYDQEVYQNTRKVLLSPSTNTFYYKGKEFRGMGSPHTPAQYVWPMAFSVEALTAQVGINGDWKDIADLMLFEIRQSLKSACDDAMHEGVDCNNGCTKGGGGYTRPWFEWANALFVVLIETATGVRCDTSGQTAALLAASEQHTGNANPSFYENKFNNNFRTPQYYQGVEALVKHVD